MLAHARLASPMACVTSSLVRKIATVYVASAFLLAILHRTTSTRRSGLAAAHWHQPPTPALHDVPPPPPPPPLPQASVPSDAHEDDLRFDYEVYAGRQPTAHAPYVLADNHSSSVVLLERHLHKNGGSTMRDLFYRNEMLGECLYWGYTSYDWQWRHVMRALRAYVQAIAEPNPPRGVRLCAEVHYPAGGFNMTELAALRELMHSASLLSHQTSRLVLVTRLRRPADLYNSFYRWAVLPKQRKDPARWGHDCETWAPPNLQTALLHKPQLADAAELQSPSSAQRKRIFADVSEATYRLVQQMLHDFDVVGTLDDFDATLLLISDLTGLPHLLYQQRTPRKRDEFTGDEIEPPLQQDERDAGTSCTSSHVQALAPWDVALYDEFSTAFARRISAQGADFQRRLVSFKAAMRAQSQTSATGQASDDDAQRPDCRSSKSAVKYLLRTEKQAFRCPHEMQLDQPTAQRFCRAVQDTRVVICAWQLPNGSFPDESETKRRRSDYDRRNYCWSQYQKQRKADASLEERVLKEELARCSNGTRE